MGGGGREAGERGEVATRKFKQTNTATPRPPLPAPLGQKLCGRMRGAAAGPAAWTPNEAGGGGGGIGAGVQAPSLGLARAALPRCGPKFLSRAAADWIPVSVFIYIFIISLPRPLLSCSSPRLLSPTTLAPRGHASFHTPAPLPEDLGREEGTSWVAGAEEGATRGWRGRGQTRGGEGRAIRRVSCAEVLVVARAGGGGGGEWDVMDSDFSFIHEEGRGPGRKAAEDQ